MSELRYRVHDMAAIYPVPTPEEYTALKENIRAEGVKYPVMFWKDAKGNDWLIDGRTRMKIVDELIKEGVTHAANGNEIRCEIVHYSDPSELKALIYIRSVNLTRRNLTPAQRAAVAIKDGMLARMYQAKEEGVRPGDLPEPGEGDTAANLAKAAGTNRQYIYQCNRLAKYHPDLLDRVAAGDLSIPSAMKIAARRDKGLPDEAEDGEEPDKVEVDQEGDKPAVLDGLKNPVAPDMEAEFKCRDEIRAMVRLVKKLLADAEAVVQGPGGGHMSLEMLRTDLGNFRRHLEDHQPHAPCPNCSATGKSPDNPRKKCEKCGGTKYLDRIGWKQVDPETRALFEKKESPE